MVCPWLGYKYDIRTGCHRGNPEVRHKGVPVKVENGAVYLLV